MSANRFSLNCEQTMMEEPFSLEEQSDPRSFTTMQYSVQDVQRISLTAVHGMSYKPSTKTVLREYGPEFFANTRSYAFRPQGNPFRSSVQLGRSAKNGALKKQGRSAERKATRTKPFPPPFSISWLSSFSALWYYWLNTRTRLPITRPGGCSRAKRSRLIRTDEPYVFKAKGQSRRSQSCW